MVQESLCLTIYDHFGEYGVTKTTTKKRPCEECPCGPGHVRVWVKKNHPIIQSSNPIQLSYQFYYNQYLFYEYPINFLLNRTSSVLIPY